MRRQTNSPPKSRAGQALIEYALILVLVAIALAAALIATGPALGNVFSNTVFNLIGITGTPRDLAAQGGSVAFWQTVTAVALHPPGDRGFPPNPPPLPSDTPTPGPSPTPSPVTPSATPSFTPTKPPTATPTDHSFVAPFVDPIDQPAWWRVDSSVYLGGDDWRGEYYACRDLSCADPIIKYNKQLGAQYEYNINFDWGNDGPLAGWSIDNFSVRWTRSIYVFGTSSIDVMFTLKSDDGVRMFLDKATNPTPFINAWNDHGFSTDIPSVTKTLSPGPHTLTVEYYEAGGSAGVILNMSQFKKNVKDDANLAAGAPSCQWTRVSGSQANTLSWAWDESPIPGNGFPPNMRCNLELRGSVDVGPIIASGGIPTMEFWDVWDFGATTSAKLQIAEYAPYSADGTTGGPNWTQFPTITLHTGGKNYAWTRNRITLPTVPSGKITYRFILESNGSAGIRRYYVDDIKIDNVSGRNMGICSVSKDTCGTFWNLDSTGQKNDFVTSGRWDLTSTNAVNNADGSPSTSWDVSKGTGNKYERFGAEQSSGTAGNGYRIHSIEFNGQIDLTPLNPDGSGGTADWEGDDGYPLLSFYSAYDLDRNDSIEVQWTRDPIDATDDNWTTLKVIAAAGGSAINQSLDFVEVDLKSIPNWDSQVFRLRFAFKVDVDYNDRAGWYIDNIALERQGVPRFGQYPFCDDAEQGTTKWRVNGQWGTIGDAYNPAGAFGSNTAFTDSPPAGVNYLHGQQTALEMRSPIDFNNDSPENLLTWGGNKDCANNNSGAATNPIMTFWQYRRLNANESFSVDLFRLANTTTGTTAIAPTAVWTYTYNSRTRDQIAWERVEIDINAAIKQVTGFTLAQLKANADTHDDDFFIQVRLDARSDTSVSDGIFVDNINIGEATETVHKLWNSTKNVTPLAGAPAAGNGNGPRFVDDIDQPAEWWLRWQTGGEWTGINWDAHSGVRSFHDHANSNTTYKHDTLSILEMNRVIDLRGALKTDNPTLYFWDHYSTGDDDSILVQIAVQDQYEMTGTAPATAAQKRDRQGYGYVYNWGSTTSYASSTSWTTIWSLGEFQRRDTWGREQIDLRAYADDPTTTTVNEGKRIRIRFVLDALDTSSSLRDGWWIDDVRVEFRQPNVIGLPFFDGAQNTANWITEGKWGLAPDLWKGSGGGPAQLGPDNWDIWWVDCLQWMLTPSRTTPQTTPVNDLNQIACTLSQAGTFLDATQLPRTVAGTNAFFAARPAWTSPGMRLQDTNAIINYDFGSTGRPFGAASGAGGGTWDDYYVGRFIRDITVLDGDYTFITTSDQSVRMRYETTPASAPAGWNIINNWTSHTRTVNMATVHLNAGSYYLVMEWYEKDGPATIILQVGNNNFSFSDSPRACVTCDPVTSVAYGNSSLLLDGVLNLNTPINPATGLPITNFFPRMQFFTYYDLGASAAGRTEVSIDGGFSWTQNNMTLNCPAGVPSAQCDPTIWGTASWLPSAGKEWMFRSHDLRSYVNQYVGLRFRLQTSSDVRDGWWITEIQVNN